MARVTTVGPWDMGIAAWRVWVAEVINMLQTAGLVRTSDTGQIDELTVNRPSTGTTWAGYAVFRFNDSLQDSAPVYIRIQFGTGTANNFPMFSVQIGTGTDGAGNLTGLVAQEHVMRASSTIGSGTDYISRAIHLPGFAALVYKIGAPSSASSLAGVGFAVQRTVDSSGGPTGEAVMLITPPAGGSAVTSFGSFSQIVYSDGHVRGMKENSWLGRIHGGITDSRVGLSPQAFHHWIATPKIKPLVGTISFARGEVPMHSQMSLAMVGTTPRNYICIGSEWGYTASSASGTDTAILWED